MKKVVIALVAVLAVALNANAQKFGHVDLDAVSQSLPEVIKAQGEVKAKAQELENQLKEMQDEYQKNGEKYEKEKATLTADQQKTREQELTDQAQKIQQAYQAGQQEMQKYQQDMMAPIQQKIFTAIQNVGKAGQFTYIFQIGTAAYEGPGVIDVTPLVKAEINKINASAKPAAATKPAGKK